MDKGTKRKRDSSIPILSYSAPGYKFAKFFTETSLDEIKETVRKRLALSSVLDFSLSYNTDKDTDISLENDDDFDVFEVRSHSSPSAVYVIVKILSPSHAPPTNVTGPSAATLSSAPVVLDGEADGTNPPRKKRKVDGDASAKPISSAPGAKKRKSNTPPIESPAASTTLAAPDAPLREPESRGDGQEPLNKKRMKVMKNPSAAPATSTIPPDDASGTPKARETVAEPVKQRSKKVVAKDVDTPVPSTIAKVPGTQSGEGSSGAGPPEPTRKKSKKVVEKDSADKTATEVLSTNVAAIEIAEGDRRKPKSKKAAEPGLETAPPPVEQVAEGVQRKAKPKGTAQAGPEAAPSKMSTSEKSIKKSKKDQAADGAAHKSVKFTFPEELAKTISSSDAGGLAQSEGVPVSRQKTRNPPVSEKVKKAKGKKKVVGNLDDVAQNKSSLENRL
ncbi:hypothetical protein K438DRAFT_156022 [Mycena galopus ATCC 62051]|nr:hypothetical protein K438DRAFT_156022 [Mycena galopus ATCC 62051]